MLITQKYQQQIISKVRVNNKEVRTFFKSNKDKIENFPNLMKIRHILFKIKPGETQTNKTLNFLKNLKKKLKIIKYLSVKLLLHIHKILVLKTMVVV